MRSLARKTITLALFLLLVHRMHGYALAEATPFLLHTMHGDAGAVQSISFSPDGKVLATGAADGSVTLWDAATARRLLVLDGAQGTVGALCFSRDGTLLASGGSGGTDGTVKLWDAKSALASAP